LTPEDLSRMAMGIMNSSHREKYKQAMDVDLAYGVPGVGRFRVNAFQQRGSISMVFRVIPYKVQSMEALLLPGVVREIADNQRGLILVTGATGSGKSTTLAAMIEHINSSRTCHIVTIEDPIEFLIRDKRSIISQREVGTDTVTFAQALKSALRQDPDVILVGEMRDRETIEIALTAAETGHLVMSTLHTLDASETINRVISVFPTHQQRQIRHQLAGLLKGIICQRLVPRSDGRGRVPALEIMRSTARIREMIVDEERTREITDAIAKGHTTYAMQTFDQSLMFLLKNNYITYEEALAQSSNPDDFALRVSGIESTGTGGSSEWSQFEQQIERNTRRGFGGGGGSGR
ncbi:MAG: PilT/PilU family type 4a pilus ATPase, partial [Myxococcota bacterium]